MKKILCLLFFLNFSLVALAVDLNTADETVKETSLEDYIAELKFQGLTDEQIQEEVSTVLVGDFDDLVALGEVSASGLDSLCNSVIKVYTHMAEDSADAPWNAAEIHEGTGSAFVIQTKKGLRLLTNAHVIASGIYITVSKHNSDSTDRPVAKVVAEDHGKDLALLEIADESFFEGIEPVSFDLRPFPCKAELVRVIGYPKGGETLTVKEGKVSRVEICDSAHSGLDTLAVETAAPIVEGNSGGPCFNERGEVLGVAYQGLADNDTVAYFIPGCVVRTFLEEYEAGAVHGSPVLGVTFQGLNPTLIKKHKLPAGFKGMLTTSVSPISLAKGLLNVGDIVTQMKGHHLGNDKRYQANRDQRLGYENIIRNMHKGSELTVKKWDGAKFEKVRIPLLTGQDDFELIPRIYYGKRLRYFVFGGCVFQALDKRTFEGGLDLGKLHLLYSEKTKADEELILLTKVLPHGVNTGYHRFSDKVLKSVNGKDINNLKELISSLESCEEEFVTIIFKDNSQVVLEREAAVHANPEILAGNRISADRSEDLQ